MTAPTHVAFGILCAACAGTEYANAAACGIGALLPDLDHPQSALGRVFFFLSHPLNTRFGHRGVIHGLILWGPVMIAGLILQSPLTLWLALGALSHITIDAYNVSGVRALEPFTQKPIVCFKRDWRITTGSVKELVLLGVLILLIFAMNYAQSIGGPRKLINMLLGSPKITAEEYLKAGLKHCRADGQFRWQDGRIEQVNWLVVGTEGSHLLYWDGKQLIKNGDDGEFLRSKLKQTEESWSLVKVRGFVRVSELCFWLDNEKNQKWHIAKAGSLATGSIKMPPGKILQLETAESLPNINLSGWTASLSPPRTNAQADDAAAHTAENDVIGRQHF